jgi:hypothetical protein
MTKERVYTVLLRIKDKLSRCNDIRLPNLNLMIQIELLNEEDNVRIVVNKLFKDTRNNLLREKRKGITYLHYYLINEWCIEMWNANSNFDHAVFRKFFNNRKQNQIKQHELFLEEWDHFVQTFGVVTEENLEHAYGYIEITYESEYVKYAIKKEISKMDLK